MGKKFRILYDGTDLAQYDLDGDEQAIAGEVLEQKNEENREYDGFAAARKKIRADNAELGKLGISVPKPGTLMNTDHFLLHTLREDLEALLPEDRYGAELKEIAPEEAASSPEPNVIGIISLDPMGNEIKMRLMTEAEEEKVKAVAKKYMAVMDERLQELEKRYGFAKNHPAGEKNLETQKNPQAIEYIFLLEKKWQMQSIVDGKSLDIAKLTLGDNISLEGMMNPLTRPGLKRGRQKDNSIKDATFAYNVMPVQDCVYAMHMLGQERDREIARLYKDGASAFNNSYKSSFLRKSYDALYLLDKSIAAAGDEEIFEEFQGFTNGTTDLTGSRGHLRHCKIQVEANIKGLESGWNIPDLEALGSITHIAYSLEMGLERAEKALAELSKEIQAEQKKLRELGTKIPEKQAELGEPLEELGKLQEGLRKLQEERSGMGSKEKQLLRKEIGLVERDLAEDPGNPRLESTLEKMKQKLSQMPKTKEEEDQLKKEQDQLKKIEAVEKELKELRDLQKQATEGLEKVQMLQGKQAALRAENDEVRKKAEACRNFVDEELFQPLKGAEDRAQRLQKGISLIGDVHLSSLPLFSEAASMGQREIKVSLDTLDTAAKRKLAPNEAASNFLPVTCVDPPRYDPKNMKEEIAQSRLYARLAEIKDFVDERVNTSHEEKANPALNTLQMELAYFQKFVGKKGADFRAELGKKNLSIEQFGEALGEHFREVGLELDKKGLIPKAERRGFFSVTGSKGKKDLMFPAEMSAPEALAGGKAFVGELCEDAMKTKGSYWAGREFLRSTSLRLKSLQRELKSVDNALWDSDEFKDMRGKFKALARTYNEINREFTEEKKFSRENMEELRKAANSLRVYADYYLAAKDSQNKELEKRSSRGQKRYALAAAFVEMGREFEYTLKNARAYAGVSDVENERSLLFGQTEKNLKDYKVSQQVSAFAKQEMETQKARKLNVKELQKADETATDRRLTQRVQVTKRNIQAKREQEARQAQQPARH